MDVVFGTSSKGKQTVIYRNFEYVKERENRCGTTSWRCQSFKVCSAKRAWLPQAIVSLVTDSQSTLDYVNTT